MIIGIDEVGDFATYSQRYNFFVAVLIDQTGDSLNQKEQAFINWESTISDDKKENGEIKGRLLSETDLLNFSNDVISSDQPIRIKSVCFKPSDNSIDSMKKYKQLQIASMEEVIDKFIEKGVDHVVTKFKAIKKWFASAKKVNYQHYMKMLLLNKCIAIVHNDAIGVSILLEMLTDKEAKNLLNMEFKIDQIFLDTENRQGYWKEILRNTLVNESKENPAPVIDKWRETGHPFLDKYGADGYLNFTDLFENHCNFVDSKEHFEVRVADIAATIIHRRFNKDECNEVYNSLYNWRAGGKVQMPYGIKLLNDNEIEKYTIE